MVARVMIKPVFLVLQVIVVYFSAIRSGAWWVWVGPDRILDISSAFFFLLILGAFFYDAGYKHYSRGEMGRNTFLWVYAIPGVLALIGFVLGLIFVERFY